MERNCYVDINGACGFYTDVFHGSNHDPVLLLQKAATLTLVQPMMLSSLKFLPVFVVVFKFPFLL